MTSPSSSNQIADESLMQQPLKWLLLSVLVIVLDQITKLWAVATLADGSVIDILPVLDFGLAYNTGAAFSFLADAGGWQKYFFSAVAIGVSVYLAFEIAKAKKAERQMVVSYALVIGGALGNLIDRLRIEKVIDFIHIFYQEWHFPYFNIADMAITLGAILLIMEAFKLRIIKG